MAPVSSRVPYLLSLIVALNPHATEIVVLYHGKVAERGTYDQLTGSDGAFARLGHPQARLAARPDRERIPA